MNVSTKFNVGETVATVDKETMKIIEQPISMISVYIFNDKVKISYMLEDNKGIYEEDLCFVSKEHLVNYMLSR